MRLVGDVPAELACVYVLQADVRLDYALSIDAQAAAFAPANYAMLLVLVGRGIPFSAVFTVPLNYPAEIGGGNTHC